jgi:hypothetical protein
VALGNDDEVRNEESSDHIEPENMFSLELKDKEWVDD